MSIFKKLFGKAENQANVDVLKQGDTFIAVDEKTAMQLTRLLSPEQKKQFQESTIPLVVAPLYMHYWTPNLKCEDPDDPTWQNQAIYFWKAEEPFQKKSLPDFFESFDHKYFVFRAEVPNITMHSAKVVPWFGKPGLGEKYWCEISNKEVTLPELHKLNVISYIEPVELSNDNFDVLNNRDKYFLLLDERIVQFNNEQFYLYDDPISIDRVYELGALHIVKRVEL